MISGMKRYTARLGLSNGQPEADIKAAVDRELLNAPFPLTFRLGAIARPAPGACLVEIATDADRERLFSLLKHLESKLPVHVEQVGWGWLITDQGPQGVQPASGDLVGRLALDPYASEQPQKEETRIYRYGRRQALAFASSIGLALFLIFVALSPLLSSSAYVFIQEHSFAFYVFASIYWVASAFFGISLRPWRYASIVRCNLKGIEIKYWFRPQAQRLDWAQIMQAEVAWDECTVRSPERSLAFLTEENLGLQDKRMLIKTILERASLHLAGGGVYKRFDSM